MHLEVITFYDFSIFLYKDKKILIKKDNRVLTISWKVKGITINWLTKIKPIESK